MHHVKDDTRSKNSAEKVIGALYENISLKSLDEITVNDITEAAGISRATFYRLFDQVTDILDYEAKLVFIDMEKELPYINGASLQEVVLYFFTAWTSKRKLLEAIVFSRHFEILFRNFQYYYHILEASSELNDSDRKMDFRASEYIFNILSMCIVSILIQWTKWDEEEWGDVIETPADLVDMLKNSLEDICDLFNNREYQAKAFAGSNIARLMKEREDKAREAQAKEEPYEPIDWDAYYAEKPPR